MPFEVHITENDIKAYIPELSKMLWSGQADYGAQKGRAIEHVCQMLKDRGHNLAAVMPQYTIRNSGELIEIKELRHAEFEELIQRSRWVLKPVQFVPGTTAAIRIEGSFDKQSWQTAAAISVESDSLSTGILSTVFSYYRAATNISTGAIDFILYLVDTGVEKLIIFKWLELILMDKYTDENDMYYLKMRYFRKEYSELADSIRIYTDSDSDGKADRDEFTRPGSIKMLK